MKIRPLVPSTANVAGPRAIARVVSGITLLGLLGCGSDPAAEEADGNQEPTPAVAGDVLPDDVQAISLLGDTLRASVSAAAEADLTANLEAALADHEADPHDADALIWYGRRLGYLQEYRDAINVFSHGVEEHPEDARMYRHRGHRYISTRQLDAALADYAQAVVRIEGQTDEVEPDGAPNARGIPTSTLQSNIWYHFGLTQYLMGDFEAALDSYEGYLGVTSNPDQLVAISHWQYMALRRLGRDEERQLSRPPPHVQGRGRCGVAVGRPGRRARKRHRRVRRRKLAPLQWTNGRGGRGAGAGASDRAMGLVRVYSRRSRAGPDAPLEGVEGARRVGYGATGRCTTETSEPSTSFFQRRQDACNPSAVPDCQNARPGRRG